MVPSDRFKLVDKSGRGPQQHFPSGVPTALALLVLVFRHAIIFPGGTA